LYLPKNAPPCCVVPAVDCAPLTIKL
jgi:hypothetical protein